MKYSLLIGPDRGPENLKSRGLNLKVKVSTSSARVTQASRPRKSIEVWALFDTGASHTYLSEKIANFLDLNVLGGSKVSTAYNQMDSKKYAVDFLFFNSALKPFENYEVWSFLPHKYEIKTSLNSPEDYKNYGVLIGRDIMSFWNICWDGPTSTVIISD